MSALPQSKTIVPVITVKDFMDSARGRFDLELVAGESGLQSVIDEPVVHRPGLALAGFYEHFADRRIQVFGMAEYAYLQSFPLAQQEARIEEIFRTYHVPCIVFACGNEPFPSLLRIAESEGVVIFKAADLTRVFMMSATILLEELTSPRCRVHATMVDVSGMGVLIEGRSGLGKSETALGLIKRGHALVADDMTCISRRGINHLVATATDTARDFMEIRGIGMLNVRQIFGVGAVRREKQVDLVLTLVHQGEIEDSLDRTGVEQLTRDFLGVRLPQRLIPVAPGRSLVNLAETAAQEQKLRLSGYVAVEDLDARIVSLHLSKGV
jgi:HPr kinase/phosphorylase